LASKKRGKNNLRDLKEPLRGIREMGRKLTPLQTSSAETVSRGEEDEVGRSDLKRACAPRQSDAFYKGERERKVKNRSWHSVANVAS